MYRSNAGMFRVVFVMAVALFFGFDAAAAQVDCGEECVGCPSGTGFKEGEVHNENGPFDMACEFVGVKEPCKSCDPESSNDAMIPADVIAEVLAATTVADMGLVIMAYGDRLLIAPERNAVVIRGTACNVDGLSKMVFLDPETVEGLRQVGIPSLASFFYRGVMKGQG